MKIIDEKLLNEISGLAKTEDRLRKNYNFHDSLDDELHRLLNALEPGTYVPPHRHLNPAKEEICIVLRGEIAVFTFENNGDIANVTVLSPQKGMYGMEIAPGIWHSLLVLVPGTVVYEVKRGPFTPISPEDLPSWAPDTADKEAIKLFMETLSSFIKADK